MTRRVFLHVGLPKTGTTYLQDSLWLNKETLGRRGLLVPGRHRRRHLLASLDLREDPKLARRPGDVASPWQDLVDEIREWPGDAVISHEFFGPATEHQIPRVLESFPDAEVHVVVTARAMVDLFVSRWQEWIKNGAQRGIDAYPPEMHQGPIDEWGWASFDLGVVLDRWGAVVAHDRVHVLPMAPGAADPRELWSRFLSVVGVDGDGLAAPEVAVNRSLGLVEVEVLRRVNVHMMEHFEAAMDRGHWIRGFLGEGEILPRSAEKFRPGEEKLAELEQRADRADTMLREGGFDVVGDPALLRPAGVGQLRHPRAVGEAEMLDAAVRAVARLTLEVRSVTRERNSLSAELAQRQRPWWQRVSVSRRMRGHGS